MQIIDCLASTNRQTLHAPSLRSVGLSVARLIGSGEMMLAMIDGWRQVAVLAVNSSGNVIFINFPAFYQYILMRFDKN